ncbi:quinone oxidoreductase family protein [Pararhizobium qamdonense]|uniref:quinone oxidoreductase family protein n=1 Tax=Pararhizobium qamdonense TaxID=3031126 RepID=UPI0023E14EB4|nr:quinone oxidoreductase [Pararhizobium qamdonense]
MKAVKLNGFGGVEVMEYTDIPDPVAGEKQVIIAVTAAGVNFMDIGARRGTMGSGYKPTVLGVEGAGRVVEVGPGVTGFAKGDRVAWVFNLSSYAERIVAPVNSLVKIPDDIDDRTAAAIMMQGLTASHFATDFYPVQSGDIALVHAGAGGLGLLLTQIIKLRGGRVISRVSSESKAEISRAAGADDIIVDTEGKFAEEVLRLTGGEGVHIVYDGSGPSTFQGSLDALRRSGTFCWYGPVLGGPGPLDIMSLPKSIKLGYAVFMNHIPTPQLLRQHTERLFDWVRRGDINVKIGGTYPLADAAQAHTAMESRKTTGKLLLVP